MLYQRLIPALNGPQLVASIVAFWAFSFGDLKAENLNESDPTIAQYQAAIAAVESAHGAHHYALVEPAIGLGVNLRQRDEHEQAITALSRALHVNRINKGLHHLDHIAIIDLLSDSHIRLGDWQNAEQQQQLRYWIHKRQLASGTAVDETFASDFVDASIYYANWQINSYQLETGKFPLQQLHEAQAALADAHRLLSEREATADERYLSVLNTSALVNYHLVVYLSNVDVDPVTGSYAGDQDMSDYLLRQNIIVDSFRDGTAALEEAIEITRPTAFNFKHATALLNFANWQLLFNRPQTAKNYYARAYQAFIDAGIAKSIVDEYLSEPERIKSFPVAFNFERSTQPVNSDQPHVITVFDVTRSGQARNVGIKHSQPADDRTIRRNARNHLTSYKFRPAIINGQVAMKKDVELRFYFTESNPANPKQLSQTGTHEH